MQSTITIHAAVNLVEHYTFLQLTWRHSLSLSSSSIKVQLIYECPFQGHQIALQMDAYCASQQVHEKPKSCYSKLLFIEKYAERNNQNCDSFKRIFIN